MLSAFSLLFIIKRTKDAKHILILASARDLLLWSRLVASLTQSLPAATQPTTILQSQLTYKSLKNCSRMVNNPRTKVQKKVGIQSRAPSEANELPLSQESMTSSDVG